jgi:hypothetical protein
MGRYCSICTHPRTAEITKALTSGDSVRGVASRFCVTYAAAHRHLQNCLRIVRRRERSADAPAQVSPAVSSRFDISDPQSLVATTARLVDEALGLLEHAKNAGDRRTALQALREARDGLALLMRVAGLLAPDNSVTVAVDARRQSIALLGKLTEDELRALARGAMDEHESVTDNGALSAAPVTK